MEPIVIRGTQTPARSRPASFNIRQRTQLCLDHMLENSDSRFGYVPYVGVTLGEDPPHFVHHRLDWTEVLPYSIYGMVMARDLTGSDKGTDIQLAQRKLYLSFFNELDGFIHSPRSPWSNPYPTCLWEQNRALWSLLYWFQDDRDERLLDYALGIVDGLHRLSWQEGKMRVFSNQAIREIGQGVYAVGALVDPLVKVYELTGSSKALQLAEGLTHFMLEKRNGYFDEQGRFGTFFRTVVSAVNGISRFAGLTSDPTIVRRAKLIHDYAVSLSTHFGSTPCVEPACSNMELNRSALSLIHAGHDEYWDQIDRFLRNQTAEAQFLDAGEWVRSKAHPGLIRDKEKWVYQDYPADLDRLPYDDYTNVVHRCVGAFTWTCADEHLFIPGAVMLCCAAHALTTFHLAWQNVLTEDWGGLSVNLPYNCENELGEVWSYEPYAGKTCVVPRKTARLRIRIPEHARGTPVVGRKDGQVLPVTVNGRYADFGPALAGAEYSLEFDLHERVTEEKQNVFVNKDCSRPESVVPYRARWRGNTVISLDPESHAEKRIYKRKHLDTDKVPYEDLSHFVSAKRIRW